MHILYRPCSKRRQGHRRIELRNFGEFEHGMTGYVAREMHLGEGPGNRLNFPIAQLLTLHLKLTIWWYTLHNGTLPFDDEEETVMHEKIIQGDFEDPDVVVYQVARAHQNILIEDVTNRLTIPQILCHGWFASKQLTYDPEPASVPFPTTSKRPTPEAQSRRNSESTAADSSLAPKSLLLFQFALPLTQNDGRSLLSCRTPIFNKKPTPLPPPSSRDIDFVSLLTASTPVVSSTPDEHCFFEYFLFWL